MNAWIKRKDESNEVVSVVAAVERRTLHCYNLYIAFEQAYLGRILFDKAGYWIYDGEELTVAEQEQLGKFIQYNMEVLWSS